MSTIHLAIASRRRAGRVTTLDMMEGTGVEPTLFVDDAKDQVEYLQHYGKRANVVLTHAPGEPRKRLGAIRNFMLDHFGEGAKVLMMCDDVRGLRALADKERGILYDMPPARVRRFLAKGFAACRTARTCLWGCYPIANHFFMNDRVTYRAFIIGTFSGVIVDRHTRMDPLMPLKEDYDFTLRVVKAYGCVVRFNNVAVLASHYKNDGGAVDYRTADLEQEAIARLKANHPGFVRDNPRRKNEVLLRWPKRSA